MNIQKSRLIAGALAALALATGPAARAAEYPAQQPITMVVPYAVGGGGDIAGRILALGLSEVSGQSVIVENRAGASGAIGAAYVSRAKNDGYTFLYDASAYAINPAIRKLPFDSQKDLIPVTKAITLPIIMVVPANSPFKSVADFIAAAKADPDKYTFASYGAGSLAQMAGELLKRQAGLSLVHVPYKGGGPAIVAAMSGEVDTYFANAGSSLNYIRNGKLKALAVASPTRIPDLPDVPTMTEAGVPDFNVEEWNGVFLPAGTPPDIVAKLQSLVQAALARPDIKEKLAGLGLKPVGSSSAEFAAFERAEEQRWAEIAKANSITSD